MPISLSEVRKEVHEEWMSRADKVIADYESRGEQVPLDEYSRSIVELCLHYASQEQWYHFFARLIPEGSTEECCSSPELLDAAKRASDYFISIGECSLARQMWRRMIFGEQWEIYWTRLDNIRRDNLPIDHPKRASYLRFQAYFIRCFECYLDVLRRADVIREIPKIEEYLADVIREQRNPPPPHVVKDKRKIDDAVFWELIEQSLSTAQDDSIQILIDLLEGFSEPQIRKFQKLLHQKLAMLYTHELWAVAYIAKGGCSDDGFEYFRAWVISLGREFFDRVVINPQAALEGVPLDSSLACEQLLSAANNAYENVMGEPIWAKVKTSAPKLKGERWKESDLLTRYPDLCKKYGIESS